MLSRLFVSIVVAQRGKFNILGNTATALYKIQQKKIAGISIKLYQYLDVLATYLSVILYSIPAGIELGSPRLHDVVDG